jgi:hypothetical protein
MHIPLLLLLVTSWSKSKALDLQMFHVDRAMLRLKNAERWLKAAEEDLKNQR